MRISDWSSGVCSSDLSLRQRWAARHALRAASASVSLNGALSAQTMGDWLRARTALRQTRQPDSNTLEICHKLPLARSEARRVGQECVITSRSWWSQTSLVHKRYIATQPILNST